MNANFGPRRLAPLLGAVLVILASGLHVGVAQAYVTRASGAAQVNSIGGFCELAISRYGEGGSATSFATVSTLDLRPRPGCPGSAFANSFASLTPGVLTAFASGSGSGDASANALLGINLNLMGPDRHANRVIDTIDLEMTGKLVRAAIQPSGSGPFWTACISAYVPSLGPFFIRSGGCFDKHYGSGPFQSTVSLVIDAPAVNGRVDGIYLQFEIQAVGYGMLSKGIQVYGTADLEHTAYIRQTLPPGWTFEADCPLFLSESPFNPPIPEPSTSALLGSGFALMAWVWRRRTVAAKVR